MENLELEKLDSEALREYIQNNCESVAHLLSVDSKKRLAKAKLGKKNGGVKEPEGSIKKSRGGEKQLFLTMTNLLKTTLVMIKRLENIEIKSKAK